MKKSAFLVLLCMAFVGCSKAPGVRETGYHGIPWGADVGTVARQLQVTAHLAATDSLFSGIDQSSPKAAALLMQGFSKLATGKGSASLDGSDTMKDASRLDTGPSGYCLFFHKKFGMALQKTAAAQYQADHTRLVKRYGVIDKKVQYRANEFETAYLIKWHDADGFIILARETYGADPAHPHTSTQIIHMDKKLFDTIASQLH